MIYSASILKQIAELFYRMSLISASFMVVGLILIIVEFNHRAGKYLYALGIAFIGFGIFTRMVRGGTLFMLFSLVLLLTLMILGAHAFIIVLNKRAWMIKASTLTVNTAVITDSKNSYSFLIGMSGQTTTSLTPFGHMSINDVNFYVTALNDVSIEKGQIVCVASVDGDKIYVEKPTV